MAGSLTHRRNKKGTDSMTNDEVIQKIALALTRSYSNHELADLYNQEFAAEGEKMIYHGDEFFELLKRRPVVDA